MGKIKVRELGNEALEQKQKEKSKQKGRNKKALPAGRQVVKGSKGGERVVAVGPSEEEIAKIELPKENAGEKVEVKTAKSMGVKVG